MMSLVRENTCLHIRETPPVVEWKALDETAYIATDDQKNVRPVPVNVGQPISPQLCFKGVFVIFRLLCNGGSGTATKGMRRANLPFLNIEHRNHSAVTSIRIESFIGKWERDHDHGGGWTKTREESIVLQIFQLGIHLGLYKLLKQEIGKRAWHPWNIATTVHYFISDLQPSKSQGTPRFVWRRLIER